MFIPGCFHAKNFPLQCTKLTKYEYVQTGGILKSIPQLRGRSGCGSDLPEVRSFLHHLQVWWPQVTM